MQRFLSSSQSRRLSVISATFLLGVVSASAQNSVYSMDSSTAVYSSSLSNGGTVTVNYTLQSGDAVVGIGGSFSVVYTFSDLNAGTGAPSGANYQWNAAASAFPPNLSGGIGVEPLLNSFYGSSNANLPSNNKDSGYNADFSSESPDAWYRDLIATGQLNQLGTFSVAVQSINTPEGYSLIDDEVTWVSRFNSTSGSTDTLVQQGYWAAPEGSSPHSEDPLNGNWSGEYQTTHGVTQVFDFTAFDNPDHAASLEQNGRPLWAAYGTVTFAVDAVPEPSGTVLLGIAGALALLRRRRA